MIKFVEKLTIRDLNSHNGFLGNDYQDNLWGWGLFILPGLAKYASGIKIVKGFMSEDYIKSNVLKEGELFNWAWRKFSRGLALEITYDNFTFESALAISNGIFSEYTEKCHCYIDTTKKTLTVYRRMKNRRITEITNDGPKKLRVE